METKCPVQPDNKREQSPVPDQAAEFAEVKDNFYCRLANGPVSELVRFFGLGGRVERTLLELGCKRGPDVVKLDGDKVFSVPDAGGVTYRRIVLLQRYLKMSARADL